MTIETPQLPDDPPDLNERKKAFLEIVEMSGARDGEVCQIMGMNRVTLWRWKQHDKAFRDAYVEARKVSLDKLIQEAERRAMHGSDKLLEFLLCNYAPDRFQRATQKLEHSGSTSFTVLTGVPQAGDDLV